MNKKLIFAIIIGIIVSLIIVFYHDQMSLTDIISSLVGLGGAFTAVYQWLIKEEVKKDFVEKTGMTVQEYHINKKSKL